MEVIKNEELYNGSYSYHEDENDTYRDFTLDEVIQGFKVNFIEGCFGELYLAFLVSHAVFGLLGYVMNTLNIVVLLKLSRFSSLDLFLLVLAVVDIIMKTVSLVHLIHHFTGLKAYLSYEWAVFLIVYAFIREYLISLWFTLVAVSCIWICIAITWPIRSRHLCTTYRAKMTIITICIVNAIVNAPVFASVSYEVVVVKGVSLYFLSYSEFANNSNFIMEKTLRAFLVCKLFVVLIIMLVATIWLCVSLHKRRMERKRILHQQGIPGMYHRITVILTILVILVCISTIPFYVCENIHVFIFKKLDNAQMRKYWRAQSCMGFFAMIIHSFNFSLYYALGENFRNTFKELFCKCFSSRKTCTREQTPIELYQL